MKILMDADCLIKLTKAGLKEYVCRYVEAVIPSAVKREVVDAGKIKGLADAEIVEQNIEKKVILLAKEEPSLRKSGDQALVDAYRYGSYAAVATDDAKLVRLLRTANIPYMLPAILILAIYRKGRIGRETALDWLEALGDFISEEEYSTAMLLLEKRNES